ncbi:MAG: hypothetical protein NZ561_01625 [Phycisphaerae bacterium]|nr:hypothetical protein [Phycisphaerae bacterium]MDW8261585.1 hypothetical protein [Phycisphaerales bacterium]
MAIDALTAIENFSAATDENKLSSLRKHQVVHLPPDSEVWMTGDLHDHRTNFAKLVANARLAENPQRHLVLHELIHGDHFDADGAEDSWITLHNAAELKAQHPNQVHFLLANHDLAQIHGEGIMKSGLSVCEAFYKGLKRDFPNDYHKVNIAITEFLLSLPLAIRCPNGLFFCHSLPTDEQIRSFDFTVFDRELTGADYKRRTGPVYQLIWGRNVSPAGAEEFATRVGATLIVTGHQPQEMGYAINGTKHLIIASDHNQGVLLMLSTSEEYDLDRVLGQMRKFVELPMGD